MDQFNHMGGCDKCRWIEYIRMDLMKVDGFNILGSNGLIDRMDASY